MQNHTINAGCDVVKEAQQAPCVVVYLSAEEEEELQCSDLERPPNTQRPSEDRQRAATTTKTQCPEPQQQLLCLLIRPLSQLTSALVYIITTIIITIITIIIIIITIITKGDLSSAVIQSQENRGVKAERSPEQDRLLRSLLCPRCLDNHPVFLSYILLIINEPLSESALGHMTTLSWLLIGPQTAGELTDLVMDLDSIEGLNEIRPSVYRAAMKLLSLQKLCQLNAVSTQHVMVAVSAGGRAQHDVGLNRQEVTWTLNRIFECVSQEVGSHVTVEAPEETCSLMFRLYDRNQTGCVAAASLHTALIALSSDQLSNKYSALLKVSGTTSGSLSRSALRSLLQDLSQVPVAVQEEAVFGGVEEAVKSCFNGVLTPTASKEHVLSWLQSEPCLLLWLPTLYRLSVSQNISHAVRCHICKTRPFTGLRYRCVKCVNVHVCQSCFMTQRHTRKHKTHHPVLEFCTQPTWRESLSSLMHNARHNLLPRRSTQREADRKRVLMWAEPGETQNSAPPPSDISTRLADSAVSPSSHKEDSHDASVPPQTVEDTLTQGILEDRCSEMEVTMETLRQHNMRLQVMLTQALNKMEAQQHISRTEKDVVTETDNFTETDSVPETGNDTFPDAQRNTEEEEVMTDEGSEDEQTPSPTIHQHTRPSHDVCCGEEGFAGDMCLCRPIGQQDIQEEAGLKNGDAYMSEEEEEEDDGMCSPEEQLQETVDRLKTLMETGRWRQRQTGERKGAELLEAADQVGESSGRLFFLERLEVEPGVGVQEGAGLDGEQSK
ncbi:hypothetical protein INR49_008783 [Caranx melampygus]|nr:hypothetical protein INR49_008783 [Caranx melampygus]